VRILDGTTRGGDAGYDDNLDAMLHIQHRSGALDYRNGGVWPFVGGIHVCALGLRGMEDGC
jgi:hypothetical protein